MQTQGAIGNLINRYRAVLKKCRLLNVFGSLAVAGLLVMGGAGAVGAVDFDNDSGTVTITGAEVAGNAPVVNGADNTQVTQVDMSGGSLDVTNGQRIKNSTMTFNMTGGVLNVKSGNSIAVSGSGNETSIDASTVNITGGIVNITGDGVNPGSAYIGGYSGLTVGTGVEVNLDNGGRLFGGSTNGVTIDGTVNMGNNASLWFSKTGTNAINTGAQITVTGNNAIIETGTSGVANDGEIIVEQGASLNVNTGVDSPNTNQLSGGVLTNNLGGTVTIAGEMAVGDGSSITNNGTTTVENGGTLKTLGTSKIDTGSGTLTFKAGSTFDASAGSASSTNGGAIQGSGTLDVEEGANVRITGAKDGEDYTLVANTVTGKEEVQNFTVQSSSSALGITLNADGTAKAVAQNASAALPNLDRELGALAYNMAKTSPDGNDVMSSQAGRRFLARALEDSYGGSADSKTATIESAARIAAVSAVPQMTWAAQKAASAAVTQRTSLSAPASAGLQAVAADGSVQTGAAAGDAMKNGFAMWIMPLYQSWNAWGLEGGNLDMDVHGGLGGLAVGADYTFDHAFRAGITVNMGGGYAEGSGDFNKTTNNFTFWGLGAYLGWSKNNVGLTADINHTWVYNDVEQDLAASMQMDSLKSDITSRALSAGLRGEYKLETDALDITPHVGVRYTYLTTDNYDVASGNDTVLEGDTIHQGIWTFPIGVAFSKDLQMENGWYVKPALDVAVVPAAGDIKARGNIRFTGVPGSAEMSTQTMDYITYMGQAGLEFGNDNVKLGVNYNLQMGAQSTAHGVFGTLRYEF